MKRLALLVLLLLATPAYGAITKVQDCASATLGTNASCTFGTNVTQGDFLNACVHQGASISDTLGNTWNTATGSAAFNMSMFWVKSSRAGADTITVTPASGSLFNGFTAAEISGMGTGPRQDNSLANGIYTTQTIIPTTSITTSGANPELVIGCGFTDSVQTPSGLINTGNGTPTAFTNQGQTSASGGETIVGAMQSVATTGPFGFQWTVTSSGTLGAIASFISATPPTLTGQTICPDSTGNGCVYPSSLTSTILLYIGTLGAISEVTDANAACIPGTVPVGTGTPGTPCSVGWSINKWVEN